MADRVEEKQLSSSSLSPRNRLTASSNATSVLRASSLTRASGTGPEFRMSATDEAISKSLTGRARSRVMALVFFFFCADTFIFLFSFLLSPRKRRATLACFFSHSDRPRRLRDISLLIGNQEGVWNDGRVTGARSFSLSSPSSSASKVDARIVRRLIRTLIRKHSPPFPKIRQKTVLLLAHDLFAERQARAGEFRERRE